MKTLKRFKLFFPALILLFFFSCNDSNSPSQTDADNMSRLTVRLVDEPGDFDNVFIEILDFMIKINDDSDDDSGWQSLGEINQTVDLLELTGGESILLVDAFELPPGMLSQVRLVLGEGNSVVIDGDEYDLKTPSAQQSGLKLKVNHELEPGFTYSLLLDFDVDKSIVIAGNSPNKILKPVMRASTIYASGKIQGTVTLQDSLNLEEAITPPSDFQIEASVEVDGETISAFTDESGVFVLHGVPAGTYDVTITPEESDYTEAVVEGVVVVNGEINDIGTVELQLNPGSITGNITNSVLVTASVMVDGEAVTADTSATGGAFTLENIPVGTYTVTLTGTGLTTLEITDVVVTTGSTIDLGDITLATE